MRYPMPWRRTYAEWEHDDEMVPYPVTKRLEPWPQYLRRIAKRLLHAAGFNLT